MIKVGIIGENPLNDSDAIKVLIENSKRYESKNLSLRVILKRMRGSELDSKKAVKILQQEFKDHQFNFIIYVRDSDGLPSEEDKIKKRKDWFKALDKEGANGKGILLLAIYELESLILADIESFNKIYTTAIKFTSHPMHQSEPKEFLKGATKKNRKRYRESDCKDLFGQLDFTTILKNHSGENSFQEFIEKLDKKIGL